MHYPLFLGGKPTDSDSAIEVFNPYTGNLLYTMAAAGLAEATLAVERARSGFEISRKLPVWLRAEALGQIVSGLQTRKDELARVICQEAGKPIQLANTEVERAIQTFKLAQAWVLSATGETLELSHSPGLERKMGIVRYPPAGPCLLVSPFNFPLNLVAHKVAPAIAVGNSFVLKPASSTPRTALILGEILAQSSLPPETWSIIPCNRQVGQFLVEHPAFVILSFTGSPEVGWKMKASAGKKKVLLELGGDAAAVIDETANLDLAAQNVAFGSYAYAGQICISIQRIIVHEKVYLPFLDKLLNQISQIQVGNPELPSVICGPMIDAANVNRTLDWISEATTGGARLIIGGNEIGNNIVQPTILENIPPSSQLAKDEAFAPIAMISKAPSWEAAIHQVNQSRFGLQAGIFTENIASLKIAFEELQVGGIIHNQAPTLRIDAMPYGGVKDSGLGREGITWACKEMCEPKVLIW
ncbi:MAG: aldehyde dehydrogenase family protein [Sphingobacteriia bacterium]|nr:aldehyde dehydrogenase family protein [Sphingobacteriia bacterium]